jgi:hypothetical protein
MNFLKVGDRYINLAAIACVELHQGNTIRVVFMGESSAVLHGDEAQILLTHLETKTAASQGKQPSEI